MSIVSELLRIQKNIADTYAAVSEMGGTVPLNPTSANLAQAVRSIPAGGTAESYSLDEQIIGTWIDGKPLYRKTWNTTSPTQNADVVLVANAVPKLKTLVNAKYSVKSKDGTKLVIGNWSDGVIYLYVSPGGDIKAYRTNSAFAGCVTCITLEYTKTTD